MKFDPKAPPFWGWSPVQAKQMQWREDLAKRKAKHEARLDDPLTHVRGSSVSSVDRDGLTRDARRARGLCYLCGSRPEEGRSRCETCIETAKRHKAEHYRKARPYQQVAAGQTRSRRPLGGDMRRVERKDETGYTSCVVTHCRAKSI